MSQQDLLFLVLILIGLSTITVFIVQFFRGRSGKGGGGNWWEGPWDDDNRR